MKIPGSTKNKISEDENGENVPHLEINEVVLVHCNIANKVYERISRVLHIFVSNKSIGQLLVISPNNFIFLKTFGIEFSHTEVCFIDQNYKPIETEYKIKIVLAII